MPLWYLLVLATVQGVTEFLPISSSGHLVLLPTLTGMPDQGTFLDVMVHVGSLGAVVVYFRRDVADALRGGVGLLRGRWGGPERLATGLIVATVPVVAAGLALTVLDLTQALRSVAVIGWTTLSFGILLGLVDRLVAETRTVTDWTPGRALMFGLWQMLALIPGTSRSGIVITGARAMGFAREDGARIAMLMSIPTILASGLVLSLEVATEAGAAGRALDGLIAAFFAFAAALLALTLMMRLLRSVSFMPYVIYRIVLGVALLAWAYS